MAALLPRPDHVLEANFFNTDDGPVWSDLSGYVELQEGVKIGKRRQNVFDDVAPATLDISLDNSLGTFNNDKLTSPFAGVVSLDTPVRFRLRWPNCPGTTANMLSDVQSTGADPAGFTPEQGAFDVDTATPPSGTSTDLIWTTGVLDQAGVCILTGNGPTRAPDDMPVYVLPSTTYSARVQVKDDTAGTGISFAVKARMRWFDGLGNLISDTDSSSPVTLTTAYQSVSVSGTSPANAASVRVGLVAQTIVGPAVRAIFFNGSTSNRNTNVTLTSLVVPDSADAGDFTMVWVRIRDKALSVTAPSGWTIHGSWTDALSKTYLYKKVLTSADVGKRFAWTTPTKTKWAMLMACYSGVDQTTPVHVTASPSEATFRVTHTVPTITTTIAGCWIIRAVADTASATSKWSAPVGENVRAVTYTTGGNAVSMICTDDGTAHAAGVIASEVFTSNSISRNATMHTFSLAPAAGTGPGNVTVQAGKWELVQGSLGTWVQGGHWAPEFTGLADSWTESFNGNLVLTELQATDRQKILASINVTSAVCEDIRNQNPIAYYKLDENPATTTTQEAANSADVSQPTLQQTQYGTGGTIGWGQGIGPGLDGSAGLVLTRADTNNGIALLGTLTNPLARVTGLSLMLWFNATGVDAGTRYLIKVCDPVAGSNARAFVDLRGIPNVNLQANGLVSSDASSYAADATSTAQYWDGKTHLIVGTYSLTGGQLISTLYIDGVQKASATTATPVTEFPLMSLLGVGNNTNPKTPGLCSGTYTHAAVFDYALDPDTILDIYQAGATAFAGDTVDERIGRICDWEGQTGLSLDSSTTVLSRHMPDSQSMLEALRQAATSEGGTVYVDGSGFIAYRSRADKETVAVPLITLDAGEVDPSLTKSLDDTLLVNKTVVKRLDTEVTATTVDLTSVADHGTHEKDFDTILSSNTDAANYGAYIMAFYGEPKSRCNQVKVDGLLMQDWANVLQIDMWQLIRIQSMPAAEQSPTIDLYIEGWEIEANADHWWITFDTSTAIPFAILNDTTRGVVSTSVVGW
jgi:hypothetical protein